MPQLLGKDRQGVTQAVGAPGGNIRPQVDHHIRRQGVPPPGGTWQTRRRFAFRGRQHLTDFYQCKPLALPPADGLQPVQMLRTVAGPRPRFVRPRYRPREM